MGIVPPANLWALVYVIPYALMGLGVGLILGSRWIWARQIVSAVVVGGAVLAVIFAAALRWTTPPNWGCVWNESAFVQLFRRGRRGARIRRDRYGNAGPSLVRRRFDRLSRRGHDPPGRHTILTVTADDNFLPQLTTRVVDGTLQIESSGIDWSRRVTPTREVRIDLVVKNLSQIDFSSAGSVRSTA